MANDRENPNEVRDRETDEQRRRNPNREDVVGKADEDDVDADGEEFEDIEDADEENLTES